MRDLEDRLKELGKSVSRQAPSELRPTPHALRRILVGRTVRSGAVLAAVAALVFGGFAGARSLSNDAAPIPPAEETEKKDSTAVDFPNLTETFVSARNGFSVKYPDRAALTPAKELWGHGFSKQVDDGFDVVETGLDAVFKGASKGWDQSYDEGADEYLSRTNHDHEVPGGCGVPLSEQAEITIDGHSGRIAECANRIEAAVAVANDADNASRLYLFILEHGRGDARAVFDAFAATIDLTPQTAVNFPGLRTTFVSPTYGYSFKYYLDRVGGVLEPAKELWDPVNQPSPIDNLGGSATESVGETEYADEFDTVETGLGAFFMSASTEVPDGVSVNEWVDASVAKYLPPGCYVPRSEQAPITIDGQSARILHCVRDATAATIVVDGRLYLFMLLHNFGGPSTVFGPWIDTVELTPETAVAP